MPPVVTNAVKVSTCEDETRRRRYASGRIPMELSLSQSGWPTVPPECLVPRPQLRRRSRQCSAAFSFDGNQNKQAFPLSR